MFLKREIPLYRAGELALYSRIRVSVLFDPLWHDLQIFTG